MHSTKISAWAEELAWQHMSEQGWTLIERNFFCQGGELDIIAQKDHVLAFVEVKYRKNNHMGGAIASISPAKKRHLIHSAKASFNPECEGLFATLPVIKQTRLPL